MMQISFHDMLHIICKKLDIQSLKLIDYKVEEIEVIYNTLFNYNNISHIDIMRGTDLIQKMNLGRPIYVKSIMNDGEEVVISSYGEKYPYFKLGDILRSKEIFSIKMNDHRIPTESNSDYWCNKLNKNIKDQLEQMNIVSNTETVSTGYDQLDKTLNDGVTPDDLLKFMPTLTIKQTRLKDL